MPSDDGDGEVEYKVVFDVSDKNLGGRNLDFKLLEWVAEHEDVKDQLAENNLDIVKNTKNRSKAIESIEKARKALSSDTDARIDLTITDDVEFELELEIDQFNEIIEPFNNKLIELIDQAKSKLEHHGIEVARIKTVELLGDTSRTTLF